MREENTVATLQQPHLPPDLPLHEPPPRPRPLPPLPNTTGFNPVTFSPSKAANFDAATNVAAALPPISACFNAFRASSIPASCFSFAAPAVDASAFSTHSLQRCLPGPFCTSCVRLNFSAASDLLQLAHSCNSGAVGAASVTSITASDLFAAVAASTGPQSFGRSGCLGFFLCGIALRLLGCFDALLAFDFGGLVLLLFRDLSLAKLCRPAARVRSAGPQQVNVPAQPASRPCAERPSVMPDILVDIYLRAVVSVAVSTTTSNKGDDDEQGRRQATATTSSRARSIGFAALRPRFRISERHPQKNLFNADATARRGRALDASNATAITARSALPSFAQCCGHGATRRQRHFKGAGQ